jgi:hypothetical protein
VNHIVEVLKEAGWFLLSTGGFYTMVYLLPQAFPLLEAFLRARSGSGWWTWGLEAAKPICARIWETTLKEVKAAYEDGKITEDEWKKAAAAGKRQAISELEPLLLIAPDWVAPWLKERAGDLVEMALRELRAQSKVKILPFLRGDLPISPVPAVPPSQTSPVVPADENPDPTTDLDDTPAQA